ncbi:MAG: SPOR domain-containing protein [Steroidobacteraceae bacterium]
MKPIVIAMLLPVLLLVGCSREAEDWRSAQSADTPEAYAQFLKQHADSAQAATATTRMEQLAEERDWQFASSEDSSQAYQNFVAQHPEGKWAQEARIRVENFTLNAGTPAVTRVEPLVADEASVPADTPPPAPLPAAEAQQSVASSGGFGVQLGAFSSEAAAQTQWKTISARYKKELGDQAHRVAASKSGGGQIYRLQVARATEQQARDLCATLRAKGQSCVVVLK